MSSPSPINMRAIELMVSVKDLSKQNIKLLEKVEEYIKDRLPDKEEFRTIVYQLRDNINEIENNVQEVKKYIGERQSLLKGHKELFDKLNNVYKHYDDPNVLRNHFDKVDDINEKINYLYQLFLDPVRNDPDNKQIKFVTNIDNKLDNIIGMLTFFKTMTNFFKFVSKHKYLITTFCGLIVFVIIVLFIGSFDEAILFFKKFFLK